MRFRVPFVFPWVSDLAFKEKASKRFPPVIPIEPSYCEGIVGAEKEHKNTCKDRARRKRGLMVMVLMMEFVLWFNSYLGLTPVTSGGNSAAVC